jgi:hypothetical protein
MEHSAQQRPDAFSPATTRMPGAAAAAAAASAAAAAGELRAKHAAQRVRSQDPQRSTFLKNPSPSASEHALQTEKPQPLAQTQPFLPAAPLHVLHLRGPEADGCVAARADIVEVFWSESRAQNEAQIRAGIAARGKS